MLRKCQKAGETKHFYIKERQQKQKELFFGKKNCFRNVKIPVYYLHNP